MLTFANATDKEIISWLEGNYYLSPRRIEDGSWVAINKLMYIWAVCVDMDEINAYRYRWYFEDINEALYFLATIKEGSVWISKIIVRQACFLSRLTYSSRVYSHAIRRFQAIFP